MDEKEEFGKRMAHLLTEVSACSKLLEAEIGKLTGMKGELSGIEKELARTKANTEKKQELSTEEQEEWEMLWRFWKRSGRQRRGRQKRH